MAGFAREFDVDDEFFVRDALVFARASAGAYRLKDLRDMAIVDYLALRAMIEKEGQATEGEKDV